MKKLLFLFLFSSGSFLNAQAQYQDYTAYYLMNIGYTYHNLNYLEGGLNVYLVKPNNDVVDLGATLNLGYSKDKLIAIPEAQIGYMFNIKNSVIDPYARSFNSAFWMVRTSVSPWHITPEAGISVLDLLELTAGYGFEYNDHKTVDLDGLKIGINVRLPFLLFWND